MPGGGPRPCAARSSCPPPRSRHFADPVSWQARLLFIGGECDTGINDSEDAGGATPCASRFLAIRTEEGLARLLLAVSMGRAALLAERNEDVSHFDPHPSRNYSRTPEFRCKLWPSKFLPRARIFSGSSTCEPTNEAARASGYCLRIVHLRRFARARLGQVPGSCFLRRLRRVSCFLLDEFTQVFTIRNRQV